MIRFTKRYVNTVSFIISIVIFFILNNWLFFMPKVDSNNFISNQFQENIVENKQNSISKGTEENKQSNKSKIENNNSKQGTNDNKTQKTLQK